MKSHMLSAMWWQLHLLLIDTVDSRWICSGTGTLRCLLKEMATCRHWSVSLWWDPDNGPHIESCPLAKLNGGLSRLPSADEDAVSWVTNYGSWHAYEKKKIGFIFSGGTCSLRMPTLRPASQAGPVRNPREGTSVVLCDTFRLTWWCV